MTAEFIKPDNRLKLMVGDNLPAEIPGDINRAATEAIAEATITSATIAIGDEIDRLWQLVDNNDPGQLLDVDRIFFIAHDLRGLCPTLGQPIAGSIADALCTYIESAREAGFVPRANTIWLHVSSLKRAAEEKQAADTLGRYLIDSLCALRHKELSQACPGYCDCDYRPGHPSRASGPPQDDADHEDS